MTKCFLKLICLLLSTLVAVTFGATNYDLEAQKFIAQASERYYKLYNQIAEKAYSGLDDEDFDAIFSKLTTIKKIASELVEISQEASDFDLSKIHVDETKKALQNLRKVGDLFVLGEEYFSLVLINFAALKELSTDKDIEPYLNGANMPNQNASALAYYPDIQEIVRKSNDPEELKYYWGAWREHNLLWASVNFYTIIEEFQKAAKILEIPVLELWYENDKNFLSLMEKAMLELKPAYQQFHAFIRNELHKKYGSDVIDPNGPIPDHIFQQVLEQVWGPGSVIEPYFPFKELPYYDGFVKHLNATSLLDIAERFYTSLGFDPLDEDLRQNQIKPHSQAENNGVCSANIFDITPHVYMMYCEQVDFRKLMQNHGYMARIYYAQQKKHLPAYYFNSYNLEYPVGEAVILSATSPRHLAAIGLAKESQFNNHVLKNRLLRMGIHTIMNIPQYFVHSKIMNDLLNGTIEMDSVNKYYWKLMEEYAGIEPPMDRLENAIDFPYKFYLDIDENHQMLKFVSEILGYQFYRAMCVKSGQAAHLQNCDFYGNLAIGNDLKSMMSLGSSKPWHEVIGKLLPAEDTILSSAALLEYYTPITDWLSKQNSEAAVKVGWNTTKRKIV